MPFASLHLNGHGKCSFSAACLFVTLVFVRYLFSILEKIQEELRQEKKRKLRLLSVKN